MPTMKEIGSLSAMLVDDEIESVRLLEKLLSTIDGITIAATTIHPEKILPLYLKHRPDILFLDIELGPVKGIDIMHELHQLNLFPLVVFTTGYERYALDAIKAGAFDYILKPIDCDDLRKVILKVRENKASHSLEERIASLEKLVRNHHKLRFNTRSGFVLIHPDEIFYIEASANYSDIYLSLSTREVVSINIGALEEMLPRQFIRISRHHIINTSYLLKISGTSKSCTLKKLNDEITLAVPEKILPEIKRHFEREL